MTAFRDNLAHQIKHKIINNRAKKEVPIIEDVKEEGEAAAIFLQ